MIKLRLKQQRDRPCSYVGRVFRVGSTSLHKVIRYDKHTRHFTTKNLLTKVEGPMSLRDLVKAVRDGILKAED